MKVLFFTNAFSESQTGGSIVFFRNLARGFMDGEMTVLTGSPGVCNFDRMEGRVRVIGKTMFWQPVEGWSRERKLASIIRSLPLLIRMARSRDWLLAGELLVTGLPAAIVKSVLNIRLGLFVLGEEISDVQWGARSLRYHLYRWIISKADLFITCSDTTKDVLAEFGVPREKILSITPGVGDEYLTLNMSSDEEKVKLGLEGRKVLLTVARVEKRKGHAKVINAIPNVIKSVPNLIYVIVGDDFGETASLKALVANLGLNEHVRFVGKVSRESLYSYYAACDCFIMASYVDDQVKEMEGFGIVFLEANALGKPVIGGRSGGTVEAIQDGVSGIIVDATNQIEVETALLRIVGYDTFARSMGATGKARVESGFTWQARAAHFRDELMKILKESSVTD